MPPGTPRVGLVQGHREALLDGRDEVRYVGRYDVTSPGWVTWAYFLRATDIRVHQTVDPEVIVAEFGYRGRNARTGDGIARRNVFVTTVRGGLITRSRDYQGDA